MFPALVPMKVALPIQQSGQSGGDATVVVPPPAALMQDPYPGVQQQAQGEPSVARPPTGSKTVSLTGVSESSTQPGSADTYMATTGSTFKRTSANSVKPLQLSKRVKPGADEAFKLNAAAPVLLPAAKPAAKPKMGPLDALKLVEPAMLAAGLGTQIFNAVTDSRRRKRDDLERAYLIHQLQQRGAYPMTRAASVIDKAKDFAGGAVDATLDEVEAAMGKRPSSESRIYPSAFTIAPPLAPGVKLQ